MISPNDLYTEVEDKVAEWLEHGARLVFVVNPRRRTVAVHRPDRPLRVLTVDDSLDGAPGRRVSDPRLSAARLTASHGPILIRSGQHGIL